MANTILQTKFEGNCIEGIAGLNPTDSITIILTEDGLSIKTKDKNVFSCSFDDISDVYEGEVNKKKILCITTKDTTIKIESYFSKNIPIMKEMITYCKTNKDEFFKKYKEQEIFTQKFWNVVLWIIGVCFFMNIFCIVETPMTSICLTLSSLFIIPKTYEYISKHLNKFSSKKSRIWTIVILFLIAGIAAPSTTTAYISKDSAIICSEPNMKTGIKRMNTLEQIDVYKNFYKKNGFYKTSDDKWVKEDMVVFAGSEKYNELVKQREKKKQEIERAKQEAQKIVKAELEKNRKQFKANIEKVFDYYDIEDYSFTYYINPLAWYSIDVKQKENLMQSCAIFGKLESNQPDMQNETALAITKIKSTSNGETLGEYGVWSGFKFK